MNLRRFAPLWTAVLLTLAGLNASAEPARPMAEALGVKPVVWSIQNANLLDPGITSTTDEGTVVNGFKWEAVAVGSGRTAFLATVNTFTPSKDLPGQKAGVCYVTGTWSLTQKEKLSALGPGRHDSAVLKGTLSGSMSFDPTRFSKPFQLNLRLPANYGSGWTGASGTLSVQPGLDGTLSLAIDQK